MLVVTGGVAHGKLDLVRSALAAVGVRQVVHQVAQRPGKPMWFGVGPEGQAVFGLPGNPVAALTCLRRYVVPAIARALGTAPTPPERIALASPAPAARRLAHFVPVVLRHDDLGRVGALPRTTARIRRFSRLGGHRRLRRAAAERRRPARRIRRGLLPLVVEPPGNLGEVRASVDVGERRGVAERDPRRAEIVEQAPGWRVATGRKSRGHRGQRRHGPHRAERLAAVGGLRHRGAHAGRTNQPIEKVVRQQGRVARAHGQRACPEPLVPKPGRP